MHPSTAMISFDTTKKKVAAGAWLDISQRDLPAGFTKYQKKTCLGAVVICKVKMDQKWIYILGMLVFYPSKSKTNFADLFSTTSGPSMSVFGLLVMNDVTALVLSLLLGVTSGAGGNIYLKENIKDGEKIEITCAPSVVGTLTVWFRVRDKLVMEYIASFSGNGLKKTNTTQPSSVFLYSKITQNILILESFNKDRDNGDYSCGSLSKNELKFGQVTRLVGGE